MEIETEGIKISFNAFDAGRLCSVLDYACLHSSIPDEEWEYAERLQNKIIDAFNW